MKKIVLLLAALTSITCFAQVQVSKYKNGKVTLDVFYDKAIKDFVGPIAIPCKHSTKEDVSCSLKDGIPHADVKISITHACTNYWAVTEEVKKVKIDMSTICGGEMHARTLTVNGTIINLP
jgi:hypothetical protein